MILMKTYKKNVLWWIFQSFFLFHILPLSFPECGLNEWLCSFVFMFGSVVKEHKLIFITKIGKTFHTSYLYFIFFKIMKDFLAYIRYIFTFYHIYHLYKNVLNVMKFTVICEICVILPLDIDQHNHGLWEYNFKSFGKVIRL